MADTANRGSSNTGHQPHAPRKEETSGGAMGAIKEGIENVACSVESATEQAWDTTRNVAEQAWDATRSCVQQTASTVAGAAETAWGSATNFMRRYPVATFAIGVGLGFMLCMVVRNNRS
ncbi:MAG: hypothetical protein IT429_15565 [Gemmataceae bacterium]|nr:hypothetical protein [Gemmataceae bacterium]